MKRNYFSTALAVTALLLGLAGCGGNNSSTPPVALISIAVTPAAITLQQGQSADLTVVASYSNGTTADVTSAVTWASGTDSVATVSSAGSISGLAAGSSSVRASLSGKTDSAAVTVTKATLSSIELIPSSATVSKGESAVFVAVGTYSDGSTADVTTQAIWSSYSPNIALTGHRTGAVIGSNTGSTSIYASFSGVTSETAAVTVTPAVLVSISISPTAPSIVNGATTQFVATGTYSDGSTGNVTGSANWETSDNTVASINSSGIATGMSLGISMISASVGNYISPLSNLTVGASVGGRVTGLLSGNSLTMSNAGSSIAVSANGLFAFPAPLSSASPYNVSFSSIPANQECSMLYGSGVIANSNVSASVFCGIKSMVAPAYSVSAPMTSERTDFTTTTMVDGRVLVLGGSAGFASLSNAEIFDSAFGGSWINTSIMSEPRQYHSATLLANGKVLVAGGYNSSAGIASNTVEIYDPVSGMWSAAPPLPTSRMSHSATLLASGGVLIVGGIDSSFQPAPSIIYYPADGTTEAIAGPMIGGNRAVMLPTGKVLVTTGSVNTMLFDPSTGAFTASAPMSVVREGHAATLLPNGKVLVTGGREGMTALSSAELYDPATETWSPTASMLELRIAHGSALLQTGQVLILGGYGEFARLSSAELYW